jgi:ATP-binding cassette, subfamily F, member 3
MSLITASELGKSFGPDDIFSNISLSIPHRARVGLVGPNGVGKTTLLRILAGLEEPSRGTVQRARNIRIGYLPQQAHFESERSLWDECLTAFTDLIARQKELTRLESAMSDPTAAESLLQTYGQRQLEFEHMGGYTFENRARQTLTGLGFTSADFHRPLRQLSGGQRTRAFLARLLLEDPDLLLLDEPTNHLDIEAIEWLENYLKEWGGAVLLVSHDRYFLDQVASAIWEMSPTLEIFHGNYSAYLQQRAERYQRQLEEYQAQMEFIEKEEEYIRRNIAGQNTRQAQGRRKRLERMLAEARLTPPHQNRSLHLHLNVNARSGNQVLVTRELSIGYADDGRPLFHVPNLVLLRGECAAILGPNGAGKTTFLKTILGQIPPLKGESELGSSLKIGYFAQAHEDLHQERTLMEEIQLVAPNMLPAAVRDYLAKFLFTGDDVFKKVEVLSGGERGRLALACLALKGANLLLLDEPTNHLDLPSQEILQTILGNYNGTILLVSHDRFLIDALASQIWEVEPKKKSLRVFSGSYSQYKEARLAETILQTTAEKHPVEVIKPPPPAPSLSKNEQRKRQQRLEAAEDRVTGLENQLAVISRQLENPPADPGKLQQLGGEYVRLENALNEALNEWEKLNQIYGQN